MMIPTVKVKGGPKGTRLINEADFDPAIHELADAKPKPAPKPRTRRKVTK